MTQVEMRELKKQLHKTIVDLIVQSCSNDDELDEAWSYVERLAEIELMERDYRVEGEK